MSKINEQKLPISRVCIECGTTLPVYPGKYPVNCPNCGAELTVVPDAEDLNKAQRLIHILNIGMGDMPAKIGGNGNGKEEK